MSENNTNFEFINKLMYLNENEEITIENKTVEIQNLIGISEGATLKFVNCNIIFNSKFTISIENKGNLIFDNCKFIVKKADIKNCKNIIINNCIFEECENFIFNSEGKSIINIDKCKFIGCKNTIFKNTYLAEINFSNSEINTHTGTIIGKGNINLFNINVTKNISNEFLFIADNITIKESKFTNNNTELITTINLDIETSLFKDNLPIKTPSIVVWDKISIKNCEFNNVSGIMPVYAGRGIIKYVNFINCHGKIITMGHSSIIENCNFIGCNSNEDMFAQKLQPILRFDYTEGCSTVRNCFFDSCIGGKYIIEASDRLNNIKQYPPRRKPDFDTILFDNVNENPYLLVKVEDCHFKDCIFGFTAVGGKIKIKKLFKKKKLYNLTDELNNIIEETMI